MTFTVISRQADEPAAPAPEVPAKAGPRLDVQGLRAFAVLAVILDHLAGWPGGGFVGVDMFFVVSGFLITGLLLREHESTGRISAGGFYRRRFKRIMPAAVLTIVATLIGSYLVFTTPRFDEVKGDAVWALLFSSNWRFATEKTDYFNLDRDISPLQHFWSLSIEEQFYFVWPWLMLGIFALLLGRNATRRHAHAVVGAVLGAVTIASFAWAVLRTDSDAHLAYFSSFTRIWELGVGAFLAVVAVRLARIPNGVRPLLAWAGLAGMVASVWVISGDQNFPAPAAALPVLATALVIVAGTRGDGEQQRIWPLTNPASKYVGDASYSLYLWHFPIIIIFGAWYGDPDAVFYVVTVLLIASVSVFSYEAVENPLRHNRWFGQGRGHRWRDYDWTRPKYVSLGALSVVAIVLVAGAVTSTRAIEPSENAELLEWLQEKTEVDPEAADLLPAELAHRDDIVAAMTVTTFPDLDPGLDKLTTQQWVDGLTGEGLGCANVDASNVDACTFGPPGAPRTAVVVGDSYGMAWMPAIRAALEPEFQIVQMTMGECPAWGTSMVKSEGGSFPECADHLAWAADVIADLDADLVLAAQADIGVKRVEDQADPLGAISDGFPAVLRQFKQDARRVVVLSPPPGSRPLQDCVTGRGTPDDCVTRITNEWRAVRDVESAAAQQAGVEYVDTSLWFCAFERCPGWIGTTPIYADGGHMTLEFAATLGPLLRDRLRSAN